jgi:phosphoribosyl 1,2-cyclic phosphodiesterase
VRSNQGHLANDDAAHFLAGLTDSPLRQVVLAHVSATNNRPELALARIEQELRPLNPAFQLDIATQMQPTRMFAL